MVCGYYKGWQEMNQKKKIGEIQEVLELPRFTENLPQTGAV